MAEPIYIELSSNARRLLASKKLDLKTELKKQGIETQLRVLSLKDRPQTRDPYLVVLAAGVTASLVGGAVSRIISAISGYRQAQLKARDLHVAMDGNGAAITDNDGNPVYNLDEKPTPLAPPEVSTTKLIAGKVLTFDLSTGSAPAKGSGNKGRVKKSAKKPTIGAGRQKGKSGGQKKKRG